MTQGYFQGFGRVYLRLSADAFAFAFAVMASGCAIGPNYSKPEAVTPEQWKEAGDWVVAKPGDAAPKGKWWEAFNDPVLSSLIEEVQVSNQNLRPPRRATARRRAACRRLARRPF